MGNNREDFYRNQLLKKEKGLEYLTNLLLDIQKDTGLDVFKHLNSKETILNRSTMGKRKKDDIQQSVVNKFSTSKKKFHPKDLNTVYPKTNTQSAFFETYIHNPNFSHILHGSAGTGKTFLACYKALKDVLDKNYEKVVIIRSSVQVRDQGFLPGDADEKMLEFIAPYVAIWDELFQFSKSLENMLEAGLVQFESTSFIRGITLNNAVVIIDECQNMSFQELDTCITRIGENSKILFCGDTKQNDLIKNRYDTSGFEDFLKIVETMDIFSIHHFNHDDIVRSELVKKYIIQKERLGY